MLIKSIDLPVLQPNRDSNYVTYAQRNNMYNDGPYAKTAIFPSHESHWMVFENHETLNFVKIDLDPLLTDWKKWLPTKLFYFSCL